MSKLDAITHITRVEAGHLKNNLRMVILADYIRASTLPTNAEELRPVDKVGVVPIFETLHHMGQIKTDPKKINLLTIKNKMGFVHCRLEGAAKVERRYFLEAMQEVLGPTDNPRYLLVRRSYLGRLLRVDYHPVPALIGQYKKNAEFFVNRWKVNVGSVDLVYTRRAEGRISLLQARTKSLASAFRKKTDRKSMWE